MRNVLVRIIPAALIALIGCSEYTPVDLLAPGQGPEEATARTPGSLVCLPAEDLSDIAARPIDLALFSPRHVGDHVRVSATRKPRGSEELPWVPDVSRVRADGEFRPEETPFWCFSRRSWAEVDLGRPCYVTAIVVQPETEWGGPTELSVEVRLVDDDGAEYKPDPPVETVIEARASMGGDAQGLPHILPVRPRVARKVKLYLRGRSEKVAPLVQIRRIRVLGRPYWDPSGAEPADLPENLRERLARGTTDLARMAPDAAREQVAASEDRHPQDRLHVLWSEMADGLFEPYWYAAAPAWIDVNLGRPCYVTEVSVQPLSEAYGLREGYVKVLDAQGREVDPDPPCVLSRAGGATSGPLEGRFQPVLTQRVRFYFTQGGTRNGLVYLTRIRVKGVPEDPA